MSSWGTYVAVAGRRCTYTVYLRGLTPDPTFTTCATSSASARPLRDAPSVSATAHGTRAVTSREGHEGPVQRRTAHQGQPSRQEACSEHSRRARCAARQHQCRCTSPADGFCRREVEAGARAEPSGGRCSQADPAGGEPRLHDVVAGKAGRARQQRRHPEAHHSRRGARQGCQMERGAPQLGEELRVRPTHEQGLHPRAHRAGQHERLLLHHAASRGPGEAQSQQQP